MANMASTDYFVHGSKNDVEKLFKDLTAVRTTEREDKEWLGHVAKDLLNKTDLETRGEFNYFDDEVYSGKTTSSFSFSTESKWSDCRELFELLAEKYNVTILFYVEECGCELFQTNDTEGKYFTANFVIDNMGNGDYELCEEWSEVREYFIKRFNYSPTSYKELEKWVEENDDCDISLHQIERI
jgi:hypothetical protein